MQRRLDLVYIRCPRLPPGLQCIYPMQRKQRVNADHRKSMPSMNQVKVVKAAGAASDAIDGLRIARGSARGPAPRP